MTINPLVVPFPDFVTNEFINPEEFDSNNDAFKVKLNEVITSLNGVKNAGTVLWTGAYYPASTATISPSKKLSECNQGWILIWSDYDTGVGANDYDFFTSPLLPKWYGTAMNGKSHLFVIPTSLSTTSFTTTGKRLYIYDDKIVGHDDNDESGTNSRDVVLRAIIES